MTVLAPKSNDNFDKLSQTVKKALSDREAFERKIQAYGIPPEDFDRIVVSILSEFLPGSSFATGGVFTISAESLYVQLTDAEKREVRQRYEDMIACNHWKVVPPVQWAGPAFEESGGVKGTKFAFFMQFGGLKRKAFVDVGAMKLDQIRAEVSAYRPESVGEAMPKEVCERVAAHVHQVLAGGQNPREGDTIDWN